MNTPDISDQYPEIPFLHGFKSFGKFHSLMGQIETILCPDDNSLVRPLLSSEGKGKILFIDGQESQNVALLGDNLAEAAISNNWGGVIVNGFVRDVQILKDLPIAVFALGACPKKSKKNQLGEVGVKLKVQGFEIRKGFWAYADLNGILISEHQLKI
tara:strand:+ start:933 stop:1403 length:471 start_codon:yes stop_codon:yes gene_type:complete